ncbi:DUF2905 domain-containing protein [Candidatus Neptunichlamydia sp. REUL1]|jgi:hypothetical protein|uniref:DUF2905 domain-containing protein n=1 Tax=Candidatus Neptunichlamydia sp. REUL1 TaxID=3064277 RepID=UPI00403D9708
MGRLIILVGVCLIIIGTLITLHIPMNWIGHLPGDFSLEWGGTIVFVPITTAIVFSFMLSVLLFLFSRR